MTMIPHPLRSALAVVVLSVIVGSCGGGDATGSTVEATTTSTVVSTTVAPPEGVETLTLTKAWGCGHGFWMSDQGETMGLLIDMGGVDQASLEAGTPVELPNEQWRATVMLGEDLFANWCNDVIDETTPQPVITAEMEITGGTVVPVNIPPLDMECQGDEATLEVRGLTAAGPDGDVTIPDMTMVNTSWGCFAG